MKINNLGTFRDHQGETYEILEKVEEITSRGLNEPAIRHDGTKSYETACGIPVNVKNGVFVTWDDVVLTQVG
ncbi:hypothetical protein J3L16_15510 [Alteromonas sp. 5E99-2]|uniref:hypothetical protein n=1 Tax=Alteromonas sp. 5E99-2 TaxID=2817683 RepID=UPI001A9838FD|nr:hypothetical protein [Alteromonas sp. 5E99-2]MBO1257091.1 hypothetical protein [Alteromonas sp. 5E99-2]